jgi:uncharacterized membrane protein
LRLLFGVLIGAIGGFALGALLGVLITLFNNAVLVPRGQAATGSFSFWVPFFGAAFAIIGAVFTGLFMYFRTGGNR